MIQNSKQDITLPKKKERKINKQNKKQTNKTKQNTKTETKTKENKNLSHKVTFYIWEQYIMQSPKDL